MSCYGRHLEEVSGHISDIAWRASPVPLPAFLRLKAISLFSPLIWQVSQRRILHITLWDFNGILNSFRLAVLTFKYLPTF